MRPLSLQDFQNSRSKLASPARLLALRAAPLFFRLDIRPQDGIHSRQMTFALRLKPFVPGAARRLRGRLSFADVFDDDANVPEMCGDLERAPEGLNVAA
jgi:hypothetical protein